MTSTITDLPGHVETVLGPVDVSRLGFTLPHEHLCASSPGIWRVWPELMGGRDPFLDRVVGKLSELKAEGVDTVVDLSPFDAGRDVVLARDASTRSGVQVIACTGHWLDPSLSMLNRTADELADFFIREIEVGIEHTGIKAGVIKVASGAGELTEFEEKILRGAARAARATGVPITTHSNSLERGGRAQAQIFEDEGVDPSRVCIGHNDDSDDLDYLDELIRRGYTLGFDHLTRAVDPDPAWGVLPWRRRTEILASLIEAGFVRQLFVSNDWLFGYSMQPTGMLDAFETMNPDGMLFVTRRVLPYLGELGVSAADVDVLTRENPARFLARTEPR